MFVLLFIFAAFGFSSVYAGRYPGLSPLSAAVESKMNPTRVDVEHNRFAQAVVDFQVSDGVPFAEELTSQYIEDLQSEVVERLRPNIQTIQANNENIRTNDNIVSHYFMPDEEVLGALDYLKTIAPNQTGSQPDSFFASLHTHDFASDFGSDDDSFDSVNGILANDFLPTGGQSEVHRPGVSLTNTPRDPNSDHNGSVRRRLF